MKSTSNHYTPGTLPEDEYGHLIGADTDPYGSLEFATGSGDDFVCFDYFLGAIDGRTVFVIHGTLNSETGSFIQDFDYQVIDSLDTKFKALGDFERAAISATQEMVDQACDWVGESDLKHDRAGWNQDPYFVTRSVARELANAMGHEPRIPYDGRGWSARFGGAKINALCDSLADTPLHLPVTRKPTRKERTR